MACKVIRIYSPHKLYIHMSVCTIYTCTRVWPQPELPAGRTTRGFEDCAQGHGSSLQQLSLLSQAMEGCVQ